MFLVRDSPGKRIGPSLADYLCEARKPAVSACVGSEEAPLGSRSLTELSAGYVVDMFTRGRDVPLHEVGRRTGAVSVRCNTEAPA